MTSPQDRSTAPPSDQVARGVHYCFRLAPTPEASGQIFSETGTDYFYGSHKTEPSRSAYSLLNLLRKPDFLVLDHDGREILRISRQTRVHPIFNVFQNGEVVGSIQRRTIFRNQYQVTLKDRQTWTFQMPLFKVDFYGESSNNSRVWVRVGPSKIQWNLLFETGADDMRLLAVLAFIHREWWCYS